MTTRIRDAFAEYLPLINMCECDTCQAKSRASQSFHRFGYHEDEPAMWAAISDLLHELVEGRHVRMSIHERARVEQEKNVAAGRPRYGKMPVRVSMRDFYATGMGLGISGGLRTASGVRF